MFVSSPNRMSQWEILRRESQNCNSRPSNILTSALLISLWEHWILHFHLLNVHLFQLHWSRWWIVQIPCSQNAKMLMLTFLFTQDTSSQVWSGIPAHGPSLQPNHILKGFVIYYRVTWNALNVQHLHNCGSGYFRAFRQMLREILWVCKIRREGDKMLALDYLEKSRVWLNTSLWLKWTSYVTLLSAPLKYTLLPLFVVMKKISWTFTLRGEINS